MRQTFDLILIRTFVSVADNASMTIAANALHLTQGAVSQHVKRLENQLGGSLFKRRRSGLALTPLGEFLLDRARHLLRANEEIWKELDTQAISGTLRIGLPPDLIGSVISPTLKIFSERHPRIDLSLVCLPSPDLEVALRKGELDLALIEEPLGKETGECLAVDKLVWVGARAGQAHRRRPLPISLVAQSCAFRPLILNALRGAGIAWRSIFEAGSIEATATAVRADLAVTAWLSSTVPADLTPLIQTDLPDLPAFAITLHRSDRSTSPGANEMTRLLRAMSTRSREAA
jgi:DNA-binding transcriptional LysR family regulator